MRKTLHLETVIDATTENVWQLLTDGNRFPLWNPYLVFVEGPLWQGSHPTIAVRSPSGALQTQHVQIVESAHLQCLRWQSGLRLPFLLRREHRFQLESLSPTQVRFVQEVALTGLLAPLLCVRLLHIERLGLTAMGRAMKTFAEERARMQDNTRRTAPQDAEKRRRCNDE